MDQGERWILVYVYFSKSEISKCLLLPAEYEPCHEAAFGHPLVVTRGRCSVLSRRVYAENVSTEGMFKTWTSQSRAPLPSGGLAAHHPVARTSIFSCHSLPVHASAPHHLHTHGARVTHRGPRHARGAEDSSCLL